MMRKPIYFLCGAIAAYSLWRWFSSSLGQSSYRKSLEDDQNNKQSTTSRDDSESSINNTKSSSEDSNLYSPANGETDFTIISSHAYDYSEETEVQSHKDSFNESKASFLKDGFVVEAGYELPMKPIEFDELET